MKSYLLLFLSFMLLLFTMPENSSMRSFAQQAELKKDCKFGKRLGKKPCARKCLKHQAQSKQQNNAAGIAVNCSQQLYAVLDSLQSEPIISFAANADFMLPHIRKHLSPVLEHDSEPPRYF